MTLTVTPQFLVDQAEASANAGLLSRHESWGRVRLGNIADVINGAPFESRLFNVDGRGLPLVRIRDVGRGNTGTYYDGPYEQQHVVRPGDLLVGMDGDFRVARWSGQTALLNQRVCKLWVRDDNLYSDRFLLLVLQGYLDAIWNATSAVTVKHLSSRTVADIPLPLPPLAEQHRVVEVLEENLSRLEAAAASLQAVLRRATVCRDAVITSVIRPAAGGTATLPEPAGVIDGALPSLPAGWRWRRLHEIAEVVGGVTKDAGKQSDPGMPEVPYLRVANVQRGRLDLSKVTSIRVPAAKVQQLALVRGDVLLNEGGDRDKLGRGWVWAGELPLCIHQNHVFRARVRGGDLHPRLLSWHANTFGRWFERNGKQSVNLASISLSKIQLLPVPVPPTDEQPTLVRRIEEQLTLLDRLEQSAGSTLEKTRRLQRSLLQRAFSGRLASQDPGDEPAPVLLERLNAGQAAAPGPSRHSEPPNTRAKG